MANLNTSRTVSFDQDTRRLLRRLVEAQEKANRLKERELQLLQKSELVFSQHIVSGDENGLDEQILRESGTDLDRKLLDEAVSEGDNPEVLEHSTRLRRHQTVLQFVGYDIDNAVAAFAKPKDEEEVYGISYRMCMDYYDDMGAPALITLTVEPGDTLND